MGRKKEEPFPQLLFGMFRNVPWWIGPILIVATFVLLRWVIPPVMDVPQLIDHSTPEKKVGFGLDVLRHAGAKFSRLAAPWASLFVAAIWIAAMAAKYFKPQSRERESTRGRD